MTRLIRDNERIRVQVCRGIMCSANGGGRPLEAVFERELLAAGIPAARVGRVEPAGEYPVVFA